MAMACLRLRTFRLDLPELSWPRFILCIALPTLPDALRPDFDRFLDRVFRLVCAMTPAKSNARANALGRALCLAFVCHQMPPAHEGGGRLRIQRGRQAWRARAAAGQRLL
jgi:hypothetical protein